jgi:hypothetical protein
MDLKRYSAFRLSLESTPARRDILRALAGIGFGMSALRLADVTEAKTKHKTGKQKKGNKHKHRHGSRQSPPPLVCTSNCTGKTCGDDGCGGSCGTCPGSQDVCQTGTCICLPQCAPANACGADGCNGSCGTCASPTCQGTTLTTNVCTGGVCAPVQSNCGAGQRCFQNACCTPLPQPSCHRQPVSDGCGGTYQPNCSLSESCCDGPGGDLVCQAMACP